MLGDTEVTNGTNATWESGENVLEITVHGTVDDTVYTVTITAE